MASLTASASASAQKKVRSSMRGSPELLTTISASGAESASPVAFCREFAFFELHVGFQSLWQSILALDGAT